jgi:hypothetical protein
MEQRKNRVEISLSMIKIEHDGSRTDVSECMRYRKYKDRAIHVSSSARGSASEESFG